MITWDSWESVVHPHISFAESENIISESKIISQVMILDKFLFVTFLCYFTLEFYQTV